ncbi:MAG: hypothetical protein HQ475_03830 [SAR202 cluster bacterium]|nr:hypothetical protein [SAR202 cluster bacterium]
MKRHYILTAVLAGLLGLLMACGGSETATPGPDAQARDIKLVAGQGQDTVAINAYFPSKVTVRAGDTLTWGLGHPDEPHTISFLSGSPRPADLVAIEGGAPTDVQLTPSTQFPTRAPGDPVETYNGTSFISSGLVATFPQGPPGTPPYDTYSLVMGTPGTYDYVCFLHPSMKGSVTVVPSNATDVSSQAEIDSQAEAEEAALLAEVDPIRAGGNLVRSERGPNGTTIWNVRAGSAGRDSRSEIYEFLSKEISIKEGDTVVWSVKGPSIHTVTFHPGQEKPGFITVLPQEAGPPTLQVPANVAFLVKPSGEFDGTGYWNSGLMDIFEPDRPTSFSMTFTEAGVYDYICAVHDSLGMNGTVTVLKR